MQPPADDDDVAARLFLAALRSPDGTAELHRAGLRTTGGVADRAITDVTGAVARVPAAAAATDPGAALEVLEMWRRMRLGTGLLTLIDVSGSMLETVPGTGRSRMSAAAEEVEKGMALLPDTAEAGLWSFSTDLEGSLPYKELAALGPLNAAEDGITHRAVLQQTLAGLRAEPTGDTGLYDSVLAAYRKVKAGTQGPEAPPRRPCSLRDSPLPPTGPGRG